MAQSESGSAMVMGAMLQQKMVESDEDNAQYDEPIGPERPKTREDFHAHYEAADVEVGDTMVWDDGAKSEVIAIFEARQPMFDGEELADGEKIVHCTTYEAPEFDEGEERHFNLPSWALGDDIQRGDKEFMDDE